MSTLRRIAIYIVCMAFLNIYIPETQAKFVSTKTPSVTFLQLVQSLVSGQSGSIQPSYTYIQIQSSLPVGSTAYQTMQKAAYLGIVPGDRQLFSPSRKMSYTDTHKYLDTYLHISLFSGQTGLLKPNDLLTIDKTLHPPVIQTVQESEKVFFANQTLGTDLQLAIFQDVLSKIQKNYLNQASVNDTQLIQGAIKGLAGSLDDPYTEYMPPVSSKDFKESVQGEFGGIGAYLEALKDGGVIISSPIPGTPAEAAGILAGDQIISIDGVKIDANMTTGDVAHRIKGPLDTTVTLIIRRNNQDLPFSIVRKKILIKAVAIQKLSSGTVFMKISTFQFGSAKMFASAIKESIDTMGMQKMIIDLRNNPGGSLDDVQSILQYFVPKGAGTTVLQYPGGSEDVTISAGVEPIYNLCQKKVIFMINKGSASASEIMAAVAREYCPGGVTIIGQTSFGKGVAQSIREYEDGSSLKLTTAKRLTGKTKSSIDKVGVVPDKEVKDDIITPTDEMLDYAKGL